MDWLWSPWRFRYVSKTGRGDGCVFCDKAGAGDDEANLIVHRARSNFVILNLFPYTTGHLMVVPFRHAATLDECGDEALVEMMRLARDAVACLGEVYRPQGLNIGMNLGECAGAGVAGHVHLHVLPRWPGDVNFMTSVGETRVVPEELALTWRKLSDAFARLRSR
jgi:ATP adenylyltransferase